MILHWFFICMDVDSNPIFSISQQSVAARLFGRKKKTENVNFHLRKQVLLWPWRFQLIASPWNSSCSNANLAMLLELFNCSVFTFQNFKLQIERNFESASRNMVLSNVMRNYLVNLLSFLTKKLVNYLHKLRVLNNIHKRNVISTITF